MMRGSLIHMTDYDQRLVDLYDHDNPDGPDHDFYRTLADEVSAESVLDLGCGTGILTVTFTQGGRDVVGLDPSATMLAYARGRAGADAVNWVLGDSSSIPRDGFDYAVMTGNVAQHIPDNDWERTLLELRQALETGGTLAFESRNPAVRAWENWASRERTTRETPHGTLVEWQDVLETSPGTVELRAHNLFAQTNETVTETLLLSFREQNTLEQQLNAAGFVVEATYGDWRRNPFNEESPIMIFVARAR
jgi:SAM-dependent methyltransferase